MDDFAARIVAWANSGEYYLPGHTVREANEIVAGLIAQGRIIEIPGDPYTYKLPE